MKHRRHCFVCGHVVDMVCVDKDNWNDVFNYCINCSLEPKYYSSFTDNPVKPYRIKERLGIIKPYYR